MALRDVEIALFVETLLFASRGDRSVRQCAGRIASHNLITAACSQMM